MMYSSRLRFQIWDYNVSHRQLLLRSPLAEGSEGNVDITFWGVTFVKIPSALDGIEVRRATIVELETLALEDIQTQIGGAVVYIVQTEYCTGIVSAAGCKVRQNNLGLFESSLMYADRMRPVEEYGIILARM